MLFDTKHLSPWGDVGSMLTQMKELRVRIGKDVYEGEDDIENIEGVCTLSFSARTKKKGEADAE